MGGNASAPPTPASSLGSTSRGQPSGMGMFSELATRATTQSPQQQQNTPTPQVQNPYAPQRPEVCPAPQQQGYQPQQSAPFGYPAYHDPLQPMVQRQQNQGPVGDWGDPNMNRQPLPQGIIQLLQGFLAPQRVYNQSPPQRDYTYRRPPVPQVQPRQWTPPPVAQPAPQQPGAVDPVRQALIDSGATYDNTPTSIQGW